MADRYTGLNKVQVSLKRNTEVVAKKRLRLPRIFWQVFAAALFAGVLFLARVAGGVWYTAAHKVKEAVAFDGVAFVREWVEQNRD